MCRLWDKDGSEPERTSGKVWGLRRQGTKADAWNGVSWRKVLAGVKKKREQAQSKTSKIAEKGPKCEHGGNRPRKKEAHPMMRVRENV